MSVKFKSSSTAIFSDLQPANPTNIQPSCGSLQPSGSPEDSLLPASPINSPPSISALQPGCLARPLHTASPINPQLLGSDQNPGSLASPSHPAGSPAGLSHATSPIISQPSICVSVQQPGSPLLSQPSVCVSDHQPASPLFTHPSVSVSDHLSTCPIITHHSVCVSDQLPASPIISQPSINSPGSPEGSSFPTSLTITQPSVCGQHPGNPAISVHLIRSSSPVCSISRSSTPLIHHSNSPVTTSSVCTTFHSVSISSTVSSQHPDSAKASSLSLHPPGSSTNPAQPASPANLQPLTSGHQLRSPVTIDSVSVSNITPSSATLADNHLCPLCTKQFSSATSLWSHINNLHISRQNSPSSVSLCNITD